MVSPGTERGKTFLVASVMLPNSTLQRLQRVRLCVPAGDSMRTTTGSWGLNEEGTLRYNSIVGSGEGGVIGMNRQRRLGDRGV